MDYFRMVDLFEQMYDMLKTAAAELDCQAASILHDITQTVESLDVIIHELSRK